MQHNGLQNLISLSLFRWVVAVFHTYLKELHCQQDLSWARIHVFLIFKRVIDLTKACSEM